MHNERTHGDAQPGAVLIRHKAKPGCRDDLFAVWNRHMAPAISRNPDHLTYFYCYDDTDPDVVCSFQHYASADAAAAFLKAPAYQAYVREAEALLAAPPRVTALSVKWSKT
jgi:quinol monooxygenase YgiN